jgi:hypothetical protein
MAKKESVKKAVALPGGGFRWAWNGDNGVRHTVDWAKDGTTVWTVWHGDLAMRQEQPWFLVKARGEVQENVKFYRDADMDRILANRALLSVGMEPDQHCEREYCNCADCGRNKS